jgi:small-conductance mechanosensitive channel
MIAVLQTTGCSIKATIDQTTDTTSNITGTTSSVRSWFTEDGLMKAAFKATAFVSFNQENLTQDLAAGRGEYLTSMGVLLGVPSDRQPAFLSAAQTRYAQEAGRSAQDPASLLALLQDTAKPFLQ